MKTTIFNRDVMDAEIIFFSELYRIKRGDYIELDLAPERLLEIMRDDFFIFADGYWTMKTENCYTGFDMEIYHMDEDEISEMFTEMKKDHDEETKQRDCN